MIAPFGRPTPTVPSRRAAPRCAAPAHAVRPESRAQRAIRDQQGFLLIEVLISAVIVAMIAVATLTGFQAASISTATDRSRALATQVVGEEQEALRGMSTTALEQYWDADQSAKEYCAAGAKSCLELTVKNTATFVAASSKQFTCETSGAGANYIETTTEATWTGEKTHDNHPVRQTSIVTVPPAASIEVKLKDEDNSPVEGATVEVREEGKSSGTTQLTPAGGCAVFSGLTAGQKDTVLVKKTGWTNEAGESTPSKEISVTTGTVALAEFVIAPTGSLEVKFKTGAEATESDTFVAYQSKIKPDPFYVGGKAGETLTPAASLTGLYPFTTLKEKTWEPEKYTVYAGDCTANNPETVTATKEKPAEVAILPATPAEATVTLPPINIVVEQQTKAPRKKKKKKPKRHHPSRPRSRSSSSTRRAKAWRPRTTQAACIRTLARAARPQRQRRTRSQGPAVCKRTGTLHRMGSGR